MPIDISKMGLEGLESYSQRQLMDAQASHLNELAAASEYERQQTERMNQIAEQAMAEIGSTRRTVKVDAGGMAEEMDSLATPLEVMGEAFLRSGIAKEGSKLLNDASEIRKREADVQQGKSLDRQRQLENIIKGADIAARTIGTAKNEDEWRQGVKELRGSGVIEPELMEQLEQMPFHPDLPAYFNERALSAYQRAELELRANNYEMQENDRQSRRADRDRRYQLNQVAQKKLQEYRERLLKNAGTKAASASIPTENEMKQVRTLLKQDVFKDVDITDEVNAGELNATAVSVATRAKQMVQENKALNWETAINRAIIEAQAEGKITTTDAKTGIFGGMGSWGAEKKKVEFDGKGTTPEAAIPMPKKKSEMKKGRYYITSQGRAKWTGTEFELVE